MKTNMAVNVKEDTTTRIPSLAGCYVLMMAAVADHESDVHDWKQSLIANFWETFGPRKADDIFPWDWPSMPCVHVLGPLKWSGCINDGTVFHREFPCYSDDKDDEKGVRFSLTEKGRMLGERLQAALVVNIDVDLLSLAKQIVEE